LVDPPQVAILGIGRISQKPVAVDGEIVVRSTMHASVTFDHRALDGVPVAEFMRTLKSSLESAEWLAARALEA
jgi:pyruvate dehydrogenase E2 component (dihydrolipoamide acetyltransferase)